MRIIFGFFVIRVLFCVVALTCKFRGYYTTVTTCIEAALVTVTDCHT
jgi:hypothetical protein